MTLASWEARAGAFLVDFALVFVVVLAAVLVAAAAGTEVVAAVPLATVAVVYFYAPLTMMRAGAHNGQTFGKQALGIRVVRESGQPIGFGWGLLRDVLAKGVLSLIALLIILSYLWPLWDERKQALHDKMVSTLVVDA